jgi:hypothetical protein
MQLRPHREVRDADPIEQGDRGLAAPRYFHTPGAIGGYALRDRIPLGAVDNYIMAIFLICPFVVTVMHYTAALHAKAICDQVNKKLIADNINSSSPKQERAPASPTRRDRSDAPLLVAEKQSV